MPGSTDQCPAGQACGNDEKCSERALRCAATRCDPGAVICRDGAWAACTDEDDVCGALGAVMKDCDADGLECGEAQSTCRCPAGGPTFVVDPVHSGENGLVPTGAETNPACGFATLGEGLVAAGDYALASGAAVVRAVSVPTVAGSFGPAAGDAIPIDVPTNVTLESATPSAPDGWVIDVATPVNGTTEPAIVRLATGAAIRGFTIRNQLEIPGTSSSGSAVFCDGAGSAASHVSITTNNLAWGVRLTGACAATLESVVVTGPRKAALSVETLSGVVPEVLGGAFTARASAPSLPEEPGCGVWVVSGGVAIRAPDGVTYSQFLDAFSGGQPAELCGSTGSGLRADDTTDTPMVISLDRVRIAGNGKAGVFLQQMPNGSTFHLRSSQVQGNAASAYYNRTGGGVVIVSASVPALTFKGNRVWGNAGDQVGLYLPSDTTTLVDLSGGDPSVDCEDPANLARANVLGCGSGKDVFSTTTATFASAVRNYWKDVPNVTSVDASSPCVWEAPACP